MWLFPVALVYSFFFQDPHAGPEGCDKQCSLWKLPQQETSCSHLQQCGQQQEQGTAHYVSSSAQYTQYCCVDVSEMHICSMNRWHNVVIRGTLPALHSLYNCGWTAVQRSKFAASDPQIKTGQLSLKQLKPSNPFLAQTCWHSTHTNWPSVMVVSNLKSNLIHRLQSSVHHHTLTS